MHTLEGAEAWVLVHIEIQGDADADFAKRIYVYNYRIFDRYDRRTASLAVLTDDRPQWRPSVRTASLAVRRSQRAKMR